MRTTIDASGRIVIPKHLRDELGLVGGAEIELTSDGVGLRVEPSGIGGRVVTQSDGSLVLVASHDTAMDDDDLVAIRDALRR